MNDEEKINKSIGEKIAVFRETKRLSRTKLSKILGITQQQLNKYEKGINRISAAKLALIAKQFQCDILYFYDELSSMDLKTSKEIKKNLDTLISYFLNIKKRNRRYLIISLIKELSEE
ncbi:MAG TPA: helix-turn-helix transcriptional regulator [Rickettsiales bacterium]|nr:helix-turn-helix transcriptional regulator [Rickettsiales bacterium]